MSFPYLLQMLRRLHPKLFKKLSLYSTISTNQLTNMCKAISPTFIKASKERGLIESTTTLYMDREIQPSVKDLQLTTRLDESWKLHIFDTRVDFPVPIQSGGWLLFSYPLS